MPRIRKFFEAMAEDCFYYNLLMIPFTVFLCAFTGKIDSSLMLLCFLPILVYHYILRISVTKLSVFLFLTWLPCIIGPFTGHYIVYTVFIAMLCSRCVRRRTLEESRLKLSFEALCFPLIFLSALHIGADYLRVPQVRTFFHAQAAAVLLLALIYAHLSGINSELELSSSNSLQSTKTITNFAAKYMLVYIIGFFVVLALFKHVPFGRAALWIIVAILNLFKWILSLFKGIAGSMDGDTLYVQQEPEEVPIPEPAPAWANFLEKLLIYSLNIFLLIFAVIFIVLFFLKLYYGFYRKNKTKLIYMDEISNVTPAKKRRKSRGVKDISDPIRRKFYKTAAKYFKKQRLKPSDTPYEMQKKIKERADVSELTKMYEKIRYGDIGNNNNSKQLNY